MQYQKLTNENILLAVEQLKEYLKKLKIENKNQIRICFGIEEALLEYQKKFGTEQLFSVEYKKQFGKHSFSLTIPGDSFNPFEQDGEEDIPQVVQNLTRQSGMFPNWEYTKNKNIIFLPLPKTNNSTLWKITLAISFAIITWLISFLLPTEFVDVFLNSFITPIFNAFMGILQAISGPMIFLSVAYGIYSIGDVATFGKIGKRMINRFIILTTVLAILCGGWLLFFFPIAKSTNGMSMSVLEQLFNMILDIVPNNIVIPFVENNPMQIITLGIVFGVSILVFNKRAKTIISCVDQGNSLVQHIMQGVVALVPFYIYFCIVRLLLTSKLSIFINFALLALSILIAIIIPIIFYTIWVSCKKKINMILLVKKLLPTFIIAITTASSSAAFSTNMETCVQKLGIKESIARFGIPFGQVVFMPAAAAILIPISIFMANMYEVNMSISWLVILLLIVVILAIAAPPIPGSLLTCYTILFTQLGIPLEAIPLILILSIIFDFIGTGTNLYCLQCELLLLSDSFDMVEEQKLRN